MVFLEGGDSGSLTMALSLCYLKQDVDERLNVNVSRNSLGPVLGHVRIKFVQQVRNEEINSSSGENLKLLLGHSTMKGTSRVSNYLVNLVYSCFLCLQVYETMNSSIVECSLLSHLGSKVRVVFVQAVFVYQGKNRKGLTSIPL